MFGHNLEHRDDDEELTEEEIQRGIMAAHAFVSQERVANDPKVIDMAAKHSHDTRQSLRRFFS